MKPAPFEFMRGVYPSLLCENGRTTLAYKVEQVGLVRYQWSDGEPQLDHVLLDQNCVTKAHAKLSHFGGARHCAYFVDSGSRMLLATINIDNTADKIYYQLELKGNDPLAWWGDELYAQVYDTTGYKILRAVYPVQPFEDMGPGAATGIAWVDDGTGVPALWDQVQPPAFPHAYQFADDGAVWVTPDDQIVLQIGTSVGTLPQAPAVYNPVIAKQANGRFVVAAWTKQGSGSGPLYVAADINSTDLLPLEPPLPEPHVEPYGRQVPHWAYFTLDADRGYGDHYEEILHACWCMTASDVAKANEQGVYVIAGPGLIEKARKPAAVYISNDYAEALPLDEQLPTAVNTARSCNCGLIVFDEHDWTTALDVPKGAILGFKVFRDPMQSLDQWMQRAFENTVRVQNLECRACWVLGCDDRALTISDLEISETIQKATELMAELGQVAMLGVFSYARRGVMPDGAPTGGGILHPNGWSWVKHSAAASDPVVWADYRLETDEQPEPEEPDMAAIGKKSTDPWTNVTENPQEGGLVTLTLPNGNVKAVDPDGNEQERPPGTNGPWEVFRKTPTAYVAERDKGGKLKVYVFPRV